MSKVNKIVCRYMRPNFVGSPKLSAEYCNRVFDALGVEKKAQFEVLKENPVEDEIHVKFASAIAVAQLLATLLPRNLVYGMSPHYVQPNEILDEARDGYNRRRARLSWVNHHRAPLWRLDGESAIYRTSFMTDAYGCDADLALYPTADYYVEGYLVRGVKRVDSASALEVVLGPTRLVISARAIVALKRRLSRVDELRVERQPTVSVRPGFPWMKLGTALVPNPSGLMSNLFLLGYDIAKSIGISALLRKLGFPRSGDWIGAVSSMMAFTRHAPLIGHFSSTMQRKSQTMGWNAHALPMGGAVVVLPSSYKDGCCWMTLDFLSGKRHMMYRPAMCDLAKNVLLTYDQDWRVQMMGNFVPGASPTMVNVTMGNAGCRTGHSCLGIYFPKGCQVPETVDAILADRELEPVLETLDEYERYIRTRVVPDATNGFQVWRDGDLPAARGFTGGWEWGTILGAEVVIPGVIVDNFLNHLKNSAASISNAWASCKEEFKNVSLEMSQRYYAILSQWTPVSNLTGLNWLMGVASRLVTEVSTALCIIPMAILSNVVPNQTAMGLFGVMPWTLCGKPKRSGSVKKCESNTGASSPRGGSPTDVDASGASEKPSGSDRVSKDQLIADGSYAKYLPLRSEDGEIKEKPELVWGEARELTKDAWDVDEVYFERCRMQVGEEVDVWTFEAMKALLSDADAFTPQVCGAAISRAYRAEQETECSTPMKPDEKEQREDDAGTPQDGSVDKSDESKDSSKTSPCPTPTEKMDGSEEESSKEEPSTMLTSTKTTELEPECLELKTNSIDESGVLKASAGTKQLICSISCTPPGTVCASPTCQLSISASQDICGEQLSQLSNTASECVSRVMCAMIASGWTAGSTPTMGASTQESGSLGSWLSSLWCRFKSTLESVGLDLSSSTAVTTTSSSTVTTKHETGLSKDSGGADSTPAWKERVTSLMKSGSYSPTMSGIPSAWLAKYTTPFADWISSMSPVMTWLPLPVGMLMSVSSTVMLRLSGMFLSSGTLLVQWLRVCREVRERNAWTKLKEAGPLMEAFAVGSLKAMRFLNRMKQCARGLLDSLVSPLMSKLGSERSVAWRVSLSGHRSGAVMSLQVAGLVKIMTRRRRNGKKRSDDFGARAARSRSVRVAASEITRPVLLATSKSFVQTVLDPAHGSDYHCAGIPDENTQPVLVRTAVATTQYPMAFDRFLTENDGDMAFTSVTTFVADKFYVIQDSNSCVTCYLVAHGTGSYTIATSAKTAQGYAIAVLSDSATAQWLGGANSRRENDRRYRVVSKGMTIDQIGQKMFRGGYFTTHDLGSTVQTVDDTNESYVNIDVGSLESHTRGAFGGEQGVYSVLPMVSQAAYCSWRAVDMKEEIRFSLPGGNNRLTKIQFAGGIDTPVANPAFNAHAVGFVPPEVVNFKAGIVQGDIHFALRISTFAVIEKYTPVQDGGSNACVNDSAMFGLVAAINEVNDGFYPASYNDLKQIMRRLAELYRRNHDVMNVVAGALPYGQTVKGVLDALTGYGKVVSSGQVAN